MRSSGGSRDTTWLPSYGERPGRWRARAGGARIPAGGTIINGRQLAEIDGQPLFALAGTVPAWRDLTPGESGPDVTELQEALASLGYYDHGDTPGYFGSATQYAVYLYYQHLGYT